MCCIRVAVQKQLRQRVDEVVCSPGGMDTRQRAGIEKETEKQRKWSIAQMWAIDPVSSLYVSACVTM